MKARKYLMHRLTAQLNTIANPTLARAQRSAAFHAALTTMERLERLPAVPLMKRGLDVDKERKPVAVAKPRRLSVTQKAIAMAAALAPTTRGS